MNFPAPSAGWWRRLSSLGLSLLLLGGPAVEAAETPKREYTPRTTTPRPATPRPVRGQATALKVPAPIVIDGAMRSAMGYPRVFVRVLANNQPVTGRAADDVIQRARALRGDFMDLNLAASLGPHQWWTAVLDTGAQDHFVNQDTAQRFEIWHAGDVVSLASGLDGEGIKGMSWVYGLTLAGSEGRLHEEPSSPFLPVLKMARFSLEVNAYLPMRRLSPAGANLIGMTAIREMLIEVDNENATLAMLAEPLDMSSSRAFEESLRGITAGPRVRLLPPAFRPTNEVIRIPLRYADSGLIATDAAAPASPLSTTPFVMGVRTKKLDREVTGNFVFDTGSPVTMISRRMAYQLGLITSANPANDTGEFSESFSGINDRDINAAGFVIDSLAVRSPDGRVVEWRNLPVLVHDVRQRQYNGSVITHDGILGHNLFTHSTDGELTERGLKIHEAPFARYWIHGPMAELWLQRPTE